MSQYVAETPWEERSQEARQLAGEMSGGWPLNSTSNVLENSRVVKSGQGKMFGFGGFNNKGGNQFILVFDATTLPADGAVPVFWLTAAATSNFAVFWGDVGRWFTRGIVICNSSTLATKTLGLADCLFDAQYL